MASQFNIVVSLIVATSMFASSCGQPSRKSSRLDDLAADRSAKNIAVLVGAPSTGQNFLGGVSKDMKEINEVFSKPELGFQVVLKNNATKSDMESIAKDVAGKLDENSTLFWYYSGHGLENGSLFSQDGRQVFFKKLVEQMAAVRTKPFKRIIVVLDACFSGQNVNGSQAFIPSGDGSSSGAMVENIQRDIAPGSLGLDGGQLPFEQALVFSAAKANETSADGGSTVGGIFSATWKKVLMSMFADSNRTIGDMIRETTKATYQNSLSGYQSSGGRGAPPHTPVFRAVPASLLNEPLIGKNSTGSGFIATPNSLNANFALSGDDIQKPFINIAVPSSLGVSQVALCRGIAKDCTANAGAAYTKFQAVTGHALEGKTVFTTQEAFALEAAEYTALFKNSSGVLIGSKSFKAKQL
ncbi:MAG: caspase family protein [Proteobacteria bacterium]|nr:caspase family protein [Pseudomonadota bacterium]